MTRKTLTQTGGADSRDWLIAAALVLVSLLLRLALLNDGLFHHDAIKLAQALETSRAEGQLQPLLLHDPPVGGRYGLVFINSIFHGTAVTLFGVTSAESVILFTSALFGALAVGALFFLARELDLERPAATGAAILLSLSPIFFSETVGAKGHGHALFLAILGMVYAFRAARRGSIIDGLGAGLLLGTVGLVRVSGLLALVPAGLMLLTHGAESRRRGFPPFLLASLAGIALLLLLQWDWIQRLATVTGYQGWNAAIVAEALKDLVFSWTPVGFALIVFGIVATTGRRRAWWLVVWLLLVFIYAAHLAQYSPRFLIEALAPASILMAAGLFFLVGRWRPLVWILLMLIALVPFVMAWKVIAYRHDRVGNKIVAEMVREKTPETAVIIAMDDAPFIQYYGDRQTLAHPTSGDAEEVVAFARVVGNLLQSGRPVYILRTGFAYDPDRLVRKVIGQNFQLAEITRIESEDYHHASIKQNIYEQVLYEIRLRAASEEP